MSSGNLADLKCGIYAWLEAVVPSGVVVFEARPNIDRPQPPYVTYSLTSPSISLGQAAITYSGTGGIFFITNQKMANITIMTYGTNERDGIFSDQLASDIVTSLETNKVKDILCKFGLAVFNTPTISNLSALLDTGFEERAAIEINFGYCSRVSDDTLGCIEKVEDLEGSLAAGSQTIIDSQTIVKP